jgi:chromosomal replication initiation ATPase DnaA
MFNSNIEETLKLDELGACLLFKIKDLNEEHETLSIREAVEILGIKTKSRDSEIVARRRWFWFFMKQKYSSLTFTFLGKTTGHDHVTVMKGYKEVRDNKHYIKSADIFKESIYNIVKQVKI